MAGSMGGACNTQKLSLQLPEDESQTVERYRATSCGATSLPDFASFEMRNTKG